MRTMNVTSSEMMRHIFPTLRDEAKCFYLSLDTDRLTLEKFSDSLRDRFGDKRDMAEAMLGLSGYRFDDRKGTLVGHIDEMIGLRFEKT